jgi:hypothetical protein
MESMPAIAGAGVWATKKGACPLKGDRRLCRVVNMFDQTGRTPLYVDFLWCYLLKLNLSVNK